VSWRTIGIAFVLGFVASALLATRLGRRRRSRVDAQIFAAAVAGGIPAVWIFTIAWVLPGGGHVVVLAFGCGVGGILGAVGAWVVREGGDRSPVLAFVGTLVGAILGSAAAAGIVFAMYASDGELTAVMLPLAAAYVGSFAALGFQIGSGRSDDAPAAAPGPSSGARWR
jgi:hypothetical protein